MAATERRIQLTEAEYWKVRAAANEKRAIEMDARDAADGFRRRLAEADAAGAALFQTLAATHGFDAKKSYRWDDTTCELIEVPPAP